MNRIVLTFVFICICFDSCLTEVKVLNSCGLEGYDQPQSKSDCTPAPKNAKCCFIHIKPVNGEERKYCGYVTGDVNNKVINDVKKSLEEYAEVVAIECNNSGFIKVTVMLVVLGLLLI